MFKIGDFARLNKVTVKTLRHYDGLGLLQPEKIDSFTGYRYYSASQMPRLNRILSLKDIGFSLDEIALILNKNMDLEQIRTLLELKHLEILDRVKNEQARLSRIETFIKMYKQEEYIMKYDIVLKEIEPVRVAALRDTIPTYSEQGHLWEELAGHIEKHGAKIVPPCMIIYHDIGYKEECVDAEVVEPIDGDLPDTKRIKIKKLESVKEMACVIHKGSYQTLHMAYNAISKWIEENKYEIIGPQRELYLKGEWITSDQDEFITEIQFPVRKING
ncbi:transcriptional regulator [Gottschalkia purinilytica]|uniref:Transcriptional regulator n=1 Tax=Gottschalkia purinilytica TaxID=1503 RepID=A0A0L0W7V2_GOTPU|nr:MerR family transcriptional regulator [Gottschalkia purinilytica]KNF07516.1 transcriptional regulator [Gottschalkia purinilytica]